METPKSINYFITVESVEHPTMKTLVWVWRVYHTMTERPILQSPTFSDQKEAFRHSEKFSEELGIRLVRPPIKRDFKIIHGGLNEDQGTDF
jgi:hypothetical protein